jgi:hypothetical protein
MSPKESTSLDAMSDVSFDSLVNDLIQKKFNYQTSEENQQRKPKADKGV